MKYLALNDVDINIIENALREYKDNHKNDILGQFKQVKVQKQIDAAAMVGQVTFSKTELAALHSTITKIYQNNVSALFDFEHEFIKTFLEIVAYTIMNTK